MGDFIVLINAGYSRKRALLFNVLAGLSAVLGGVAGYYWLDSARTALPFVLVLAASSFIYIALADLVPDMHRERQRGASALQIVMLFVGIALIALLTSPFHTH